MPKDVTGNDILELMARPGYSPVKRRKLANLLEVPKADYSDLVKALTELVEAGRVVLGKGRRYSLPATGRTKGGGRSPKDRDGGVLTGVLEVKGGGFGFLRMEDVEDIFVPPGELGGALDGDTVKIECQPSRRFGRSGRTGTVVEVLERSRDSITGIYYSARPGSAPAKGDSGGYVLSDHPALEDGVEIAPGSAMNARMGDKVKVKITEWPRRNHPSVGEVSEVYGEAGDWQAELAGILDEFSLRVAFPADATEEAGKATEDLIAREAPGRVDFRDLATVTIDPEDAKDFDDAVSLERAGSGWRLYVHITDVASFVRPHTALDREARLRSTSVYLPGQVLPMLPPVLTRDICCLREGRDRLALSAALDFDNKGKHSKYAIYKSIIRSDMRLSYKQVKDSLDEDNPQGLPEEILDLLAQMRSLAALIRERRTEAGSIDLDLPEPHIVFDGEGRIARVELARTDFSHQMIEDFMLSANRAVAEYLAGRNLPALFRVHDEPDIADIRKLADFLAQYAVPLKPPYSRKKLQAVIERSRDKPFAHPVQMMLLRSLQRALYSAAPKPHYALGFNRYLHFTSPIRRYPDLFVHRLLHDALGPKRTCLEEGAKPALRPKVDMDELRRLAAHCSERERAAEDAERRLTRFRQIEHLQDHLDEEFEGVVVSIGKFGALVEIAGVWLNGVLGIETMKGDGFRFRKREKMLVGQRSGRKIRLGDKVSVRIRRADLVTGEVDLIPTGGPQPSRRRRK